MRAVAEYSMRGRRQAVLAAMLGTALPLMFWLGAAVISLVTLRKGVAEGMHVLLWGSLPAITWLALGDPTPLLVVLGCTALALTLRATVSWQQTLLLGIAVGVASAWLLAWLLGDTVAMIVEASRGMLAEFRSELLPGGEATLDLWLRNLMTGVLGAVHLMVMIASLVLARWWQARLYNPGGFRTEFHQLRLSRTVALALMVLILFGANISAEVVRWLPSLTVPFFIAAIALVHGIVAIKNLSGHWLFAFYILTFVVGPSVYLLLVVIALLDSLLNFRQRLASSA